MPFKFETIDFTRKSNASRVLRVVLFMSWCCVQSQDSEVNSDQLSLVGWWFYEFASKVKTFGATYFPQIQQQQLTCINHPISFSKQGNRSPFFDQPACGPSIFGISPDDILEAPTMAPSGLTRASTTSAGEPWG